MIAVVAKPSDHDVVREFFELFKTPWRFYEEGCSHDVLLCATDEIPASCAKLIVLCGATSHPASAGRPTGQTIVSLGVDLFSDVRHLLTRGQPRADAAVPTLDLRIDTLRRAMVDHGIAVLEIPPVPKGYNFIACLTHDVDHARVRYHKWHPAMLGFVYRATVVSLVNVLRGRKRAGHLLANSRAVFSLPFVLLNRAPDFWDQFRRYVEIERGAASTFFFVPQRGETGLDAHGRRRRARAVRYSLNDVGDDLKALQAAGKEIGVHGIDAWRDSAKGGEEFAAIQQRTSGEELGVRMHWLFFDENSPARLEQAGFAYDSTVGYNDTVGYRAGTAQVYKPLAVERLLELPLHVMDTALFYPSYLHLTDDEAESVIAPLLEHASRGRGVLTVNWHDRSLGPERLWDRPYLRLLESMRARNAWFATAGDAVRWFRKRRSAQFEIAADGAALQVKLSPPADDDLPPLQLRTYHPRVPDDSPAAFTDSPLATDERLLVAA